MEAIVGLVVLSAMMSLFVQVLVHRERGQIQAARQAYATQVVANQMERIAGTPRNDLDPDHPPKPIAPRDLADRLPDPVLQVSIESLENFPRLLKVSVVLSWAGPSGTGLMDRPQVSLVSWLHPHENPSGGRS